MVLSDGQYAFFLYDFCAAQDKLVGDMIFKYSQESGYYHLSCDPTICYTKEIVDEDPYFIQFSVVGGDMELYTQKEGSNGRTTLL